MDWSVELSFIADHTLRRLNLQLQRVTTPIVVDDFEILPALSVSADDYVHLLTFRLLRMEIPNQDQTRHNRRP
jgi:hypothetical protein